MLPLATTYNLYSPTPLAIASPAPSPKPLKKEIEIVFHHPNLLYLQKKCLKGREQISHEVEEHNMRKINTRKGRRVEEKRPKTCDPWAGDDERNIGNGKADLRCKTSQPAKRNKIIRNESGKLEIFGMSSTGFGTLFDSTP
jgi:hypothetical protein